MTERKSGFRHDAAILLRYRWFVLAIFAMANAGAVAVNLMRTTEFRAQASVEVWPTERQPVFGIRPIFAWSEYQPLGSSDLVAERAALILVPQGWQVDPGALRAAVTLADTTTLDLRAIGARKFEFTATDADESTALAYADAWARAYAEEASAYRDARADDQIRTLDGQATAAAADLDQRQLALEEFLRQHPDVAPVSPTDLTAERGRVTLALARLKALQARGGVGATEVQIALADLFPKETPLPVAGIDTLIGGLGFRLNALNDEIAAFQAPNSTASQARQLFLAAAAAERTYNAALGQLAAARATKPVAPLEFRVPQAAEISTARQLGLVGLLAAAAALGLVAGVVGAFALEFLARNGLLPWSQQAESVSTRP